MHDSPLIYDPSVFEQTNAESAKSIILTAEDGVSTQTRWDTETPWLLQLISLHIVKPNCLIVDYGCGIGRLSAPLANHGHPVIGVDLSDSMRRHATGQIANDRFVAMTPAMFDRLVGLGIKTDLILSIWLLQHCLDLEAEVSRLYRSLAPGGVLAVADMRHRAIPTNQGWVNDGKNVNETISKYFSLIRQYPYDPPEAPQNLRNNAYVAFFQKTH